MFRFGNGLPKEAGKFDLHNDKKNLDNAKKNNYYDFTYEKMR